MDPNHKFDWKQVALSGLIGAASGAAGAVHAWRNRACFAAGTPLLTGDGSSKAIEDFWPGDVVLSRHEFDPEGRAEAKVVEEVFTTTARIWELRAGGRVIRTTAEHPFFARGRGWVPAAELRPGDELLSDFGVWTAVEGLDDSGSDEAVYNLRIADYHTYFVGASDWGWSAWAHNVCVGVVLENQVQRELGAIEAYLQIRGNERWAFDTQHGAQAGQTPGRPAPVPGETANLAVMTVRGANGELYFAVTQSRGTGYGPTTSRPDVIVFRQQGTAFVEVGRIASDGGPHGFARTATNDLNANQPLSPQGTFYHSEMGLMAAVVRASAPGGLFHGGEVLHLFTELSPCDTAGSRYCGNRTSIFADLGQFAIRQPGEVGYAAHGLKISENFCVSFCSAHGGNPNTAYQLVVTATPDATVTGGFRYERQTTNPTTAADIAEFTRRFNNRYGPTP
jgi:hypothetical protein